MNDPTINQATGKPCKGKAAAQALHALLVDPHVLYILRFMRPSLAAAALDAVAPFEPKFGQVRR